MTAMAVNVKFRFVCRFHCVVEGGDSGPGSVSSCAISMETGGTPFGIGGTSGKGAP